MTMTTGQNCTCAVPLSELLQRLGFAGVTLDPGTWAKARGIELAPHWTGTPAVRVEDAARLVAAHDGVELAEQYRRNAATAHTLAAGEALKARQAAVRTEAYEAALRAGCSYGEALVRASEAVDAMGSRTPSTSLTERLRRRWSNERPAEVPASPVDGVA